MLHWQLEKEGALWQIWEQRKRQKSGVLHRPRFKNGVVRERYLMQPKIKRGHHGIFPKMLFRRQASDIEIYYQYPLWKIIYEKIIRISPIGNYCDGVGCLRKRS